MFDYIIFVLYYFALCFSYNLIPTSSAVNVTESDASRFIKNTTDSYLSIVWCGFWTFAILA